MEGRIPHEQRTIRTPSDVLRTMQFTRNIPKNDEQHFQELLHEGVLANYMDDFIIPAKTMEELEERTIRFLKIVEKHNLCFK